MKSMCSVVVTVILVFLGVVLIIFGGLLLGIFPSMFKSAITKAKILSPETKAYDQWMKPTIPIHMKFYFFNCTNVKAFTETEELPVFEERGPYVFREHRLKINISEDGPYTSYQQRKHWNFVPELSDGSLDDVISTIDVPVVAAVYKSRFETAFSKYILSGAIKNLKGKIHTAKTVREFLYDGYKDSVIDFARNMSLVTGKTVKMDKFGWFYKKNGTTDGIYAIDNGKDGIENLGFIQTWRNMNATPFFEPPCNYINGTAADLFPPFMYDVSSVQIFASALCRTLTLNYEKDVEFKGLKARRYLPKPFMLDDGSKDELNKCFCNGDWACLADTGTGVLNISSCRDGAPAFISYPHFLDAAPIYRDNVIGMKPERNKHQFFMDIQPDLGVPANVAARMQINILIEHVSGFDYFSKFTRRTLFPMLWFSQTANVDDKVASSLLFFTITLPNYIFIAAVCSLCVGVCLLILAFIVHARSCISKIENRKQGKKYVSAPLVEMNNIPNSKI